MSTEANKVVERWTFRGTNTGDFELPAPAPATDKQVSVSGMNILRFTGGKTVEEWLQEDTISMESDDVAAPTKGGIPGMRGVEHIGLTVPNLEEATEFFVNVLGCQVVYSLYPPRRPDGYLDLHPETDRKIRTLSCRNGAHFELFEYTAPDQNKHMPKSSDYGGHHVTFYVDDMDAAIAYLKSKAVHLFGEKKYGYGEEAGKDSSFVHFKTPWGLVLELISFPNGRVYEQEKPAMWKPEPLTS